jgi:N-acetylglucosaminyldiphosphoundecaprenol N-acetyl-beta-D-mannosaminyltransferase
VNRPDVKFLGIPLEVLTPVQAVETVLSVSTDVGRAFHLVNSYTMVLAHQNQALHGVLCADLVLCDGVPLARALQKQDPYMQAVRGPSLMKDVLSASSLRHKHFLLGGSPQTLDALGHVIEQEYPTARVVGLHSPEYSPLWSDKLDSWVRLIKDSQANIVWVGLGTPKQDFVAHELASKVAATVVAVGAAFDFIAGTQPEAPKILQGSGFEWLYRLVKEPRRLWRRYVFGNAQFLLLAIREGRKTSD